MRLSPLTSLLAIAVLSTACDEWTPLTTDGGACPNPPAADAAGVPDMASPAPKCAAAKGLAGDNLLCVDFKDVQQLTSLTTWSFNCGGGASWTVMNGQLQVAAFKDFADTCTARLPATRSTSPKSVIADQA